jgi:hypothetical protein
MSPSGEFRRVVDGFIVGRYQDWPGADMVPIANARGKFQHFNNDYH